MKCSRRLLLKGNTSRNRCSTWTKLACSGNTAKATSYHKVLYTMQKTASSSCYSATMVKIPSTNAVSLLCGNSLSSSSFEGIHSRSDTNRTGAEGLSFYYPRLLYCLDQMLAVMSLSQHRVSSSKTVRPCAPCGAQCIGHAVSTWSAVCSAAPHSQFSEGARPHLCMDEWNRPTPVCRRLSLTQAARCKFIPTGLAPVSGTKARSLEAFSQYSAFHL